MHLRKAHDKRINKTYLSIVHGYRDESSKPKSKVIKSLGYLDDLKKEYPDPIARFTALAKAMDDERKATNKVSVTLDLITQLNFGDLCHKNYGYS